VCLYVIVGTHNILSVEIVSFRVGPRRHHRHPGRNGVDDRSSSDVSGVDLHRATGHVRGVPAGQERDAGRDIDWVGQRPNERRLSTHDRLLRFGVPLVGYHRVDYAWTDRASPPMPALLNRASIPPQVSATASKTSSNRSLSLMSSGRNSAVPSAAVIRLDPLDGLLAPVNVDIGNGDVDARPANRSAVARPRPDTLPVMTAVSSQRVIEYVSYPLPDDYTGSSGDDVQPHDRSPRS